MCGIFCSIPIHQCTGHNVADSIEPELKHLLERRGPDARNEIIVDEITFDGFVLRQQGAELCTQPCESGDIVLLLNGDIFGGVGGGLETMEQYKYSDTAWLCHQLAKCHNDSDYRTLFQRVQGPYAMIFYNKRTGDIYYARDSLGRNSLLIERRKNYLRLLSTSYFSASYQTEYVMELPPCGLFKLNRTTPLNCVLYPWSGYIADYYGEQIKIMTNAFGSVSIRDCIYPKWLSVEKPVDCSLFDFYELSKSRPIGESYADLMDYLRTSDAIEIALNKFSTLLKKSVQDRVQKTTEYCNACVTNLDRKCSHSKIAILFSGGIDCTILACLADKYVSPDDPIDLINVAFEGANAAIAAGDCNQWLVPDRLTARESLAELQRVCPQRKWQLIEVNVTRKELHHNLQAHVKHLIYPLESVLDESIGACFWHACNDRCTTARVAIVGSGADELFGGYQRHRRAFQRCTGDLVKKQQCVEAELRKDWLRIPSRNLARDDRVVADSSRTLRAPFIEENLVKFVNDMPAHQRCCFLLAEGLGDKLFLRLYGYQLGLRSSVLLKKRAIQFGSKIANKKQNADDVSSYLRFVLPAETS